MTLELKARDIIRTLFPLATIVTPNIPEAQAILGWTDTNSSSLVSDKLEKIPVGVVISEPLNNALEPPLSPFAIQSVADMEVAAKKNYELGPAYVLVKGGHMALHGDADGQGGELVDVLYDGQTIEYIRGPHVITNNVHGTGCTLSSAIASELAHGSAVVQVLSI